LHHKFQIKTLQAYTRGANKDDAIANVLLLRARHRMLLFGWGLGAIVDSHKKREGEAFTLV
jgi:hypothetical protein